MTTDTLLARARPILFSAPMVRAIISGAKTQTRRLVKPQPHPCDVPGIMEGMWCWSGPRWWLDTTMANVTPPDVLAADMARACPYGVPGDRLWCREAWAKAENVTDLGDEIARIERWAIAYRADEGWDIEESPEGKWRPSIHMPRWASRITLEITDVRVERLQDITERDAVAEGIGFAATRDCKRPRFAALWNEINGKRATWESNPWVWCLTFRRIV